ncbi:MAG: hypothetical protein ACREQ9_26555, partial [Candidatus Binatia bacterium]
AVDLPPLEPGQFLQYPMEPLLALAPFWEDPGKDASLVGWTEWLTEEVVEPGVLHYGERIFFCDGTEPFCAEDGRTYLHSVGFPHIWSGTEMYIASAFVHGVRASLEAPCPPSARIGEAACVP